VMMTDGLGILYDCLSLLILYAEMRMGLVTVFISCMEVSVLWSYVGYSSIRARKRSRVPSETIITVQ
jgi:hypothetical protein